MRRLLVLVLFLFVALVAAACGDDGDDGEAGADDTAEAGDDERGDDDSDGDGDDESGDDERGDDESGDDESGDDDASDDDASDDDASDDDAPEGQGVGSDFCDLWTNEDDDLGPDSIDFGLSPEELEDGFERVREQFDDVQDRAPDEVADDFAVLAENWEAFGDLLDEYDWNPFAIPEEEFTALDNPEAEAAQDDIDAFCGVTDEEVDLLEGVPSFPSVDPGIIEEFENVDPDDADAQALLFYRALGYDEETARCLVDELGDFEEIGDDLPPDLLTQEFCGLTVLEIFTGAGASG